MIKTNKKDVLISYLSYFLRMAANVLLIPVILKKLNDYEYGIWNVFVAIGALVVLIDLGFSVIITRYIVYAYSGAKEILKDGQPPVKTDDGINYDLLLLIYVVAKKIYLKLSLISMGFISVGAVYVLFINEGIVPIIPLLSSWFIYGGSVCLQIYLIRYNCMIKGIGRFKEIGIYQIIQQTIYIILAYILLLQGFGLGAIAVSTAFSSVIYRGLIVHNIDKTFGFNRAVKTAPIDPAEAEKLYRIIKDNTRGLLGATVSTYIASYGSTLVCSAFLSPASIGQLGLTNQLINIITTMAGVPTSTYSNKMGEMIIRNELKTFKHYYSIVTGIYVWVYLFGGGLLLAFGEPILMWYGSKTHMLPRIETLLLILTSFVIGIHQRCTTIIMYKNTQPHIKAYLITSIATVGVSSVIMIFYQNVMAYIVISLIAQCIYNGWKWPGIVHKKYNLTVDGIFSEFTRYIIGKIQTTLKGEMQR